MPTFDTPEPIQVLVDASGASVTVSAVEGARTASVEITPHNPSRSADVQQAERTTAELAGTRLTVRSPRDTKSRLRSLFGAHQRIGITITLPAGSQLEVHGWGDIQATGELGAVDIDTGMGDISLDRVARLRGKTGLGEIRVHSVSGPADLHTATGSVTVGQAQDRMVAKTPVGDIFVEEGQGDLKLSTSTGSVRVHRALAGVEARTPVGDVRLNSVCSGAIDAKTSYGQIEIGVAHGTAAWLNLSTSYGKVRSELENIDGPGDSELTVQIQAATSYGDIILRRA